MAKFRKKPVVIEATQWFKNGDHPDDDCVPVRRKGIYQSDVTPLKEYTGDLVADPVTGAPSFLSEGRVVRYFRHPDIPGEQVCTKCLQTMHVHGWIDTLEDGHNVCPGDWIITGVKGERYPCKPDIFEATYEPA